MGLPHLPILHMGHIVLLCLYSQQFLRGGWYRNKERGCLLKKRTALSLHQNNRRTTAHVMLVPYPTCRTRTVQCVFGDSAVWHGEGCILSTIRCPLRYKQCIMSSPLLSPRRQGKALWGTTHSCTLSVVCDIDLHFLGNSDRLSRRIKQVDAGRSSQHHPAEEASYEQDWLAVLHE